MKEPLDFAAIQARSNQRLKEKQPNASLSVQSNISQLDANMGDLDLGFFGNRRVKKVHQKAQEKTALALAEEKYRLVTELGVESLRKEAQLIRERMDARFNNEFAALAELRMASQFSGLERMEAMLVAAKERFEENRKKTIGRIEQRYQAGILTQHDAEFELQELVERYLVMNEDIKEIVANCKSTINALRG